MTLNIKFAGLIVYLGFGLLMHLIFLGITIYWSSALSLFVILLWPLYLLWQFMILFFWLFLVALVIGAVFIIYDRYFNKGF